MPGTVLHLMKKLFQTSSEEYGDGNSLPKRCMTSTHQVASHGCRTTGGSVGNGAIATMPEGDSGNIAVSMMYVMLLLKSLGNKGRRKQTSLAVNF